MNPSETDTEGASALFRCMYRRLITGTWCDEFYPFQAKVVLFVLVVLGFCVLMSCLFVAIGDAIEQEENPTEVAPLQMDTKKRV